MEGSEHEVMANLYLILDSDNKVVDLSLEDGVFYQEVENDIDLEQIKENLGISNGNVYWDNHLYIKEVDLEVENALLKRQVATLSSELELRDDILQDLIINSFN